MNWLLDTHVWIWSQESPERLGDVAQRTLLDPTQNLHVSAVSALEIARLVDADLIEMPGSLARWVARSIEFLGGRLIDVTSEIALGAYALPGVFHKDPADRILVATARARRLTLLTADERILAYPHVHSRDVRV